MGGSWHHHVRPRRYGPIARWYDVVSFERLVYRSGRVAAIEALQWVTGRERPHRRAGRGDAGGRPELDGCCSRDWRHSGHWSWPPEWSP